MKLSRVATFCALSLLLTAETMTAGTIYYLGAEDTAGNVNIEQTGDFNDMILKIVADDLTAHSTNGVWNPMVLPNEGSTPFWDQQSMDGPQRNIGYCLLNLANCLELGSPVPNLSYYSTASEGSVNNFTFTGSGDISVTLMIQLTSHAIFNSFGYYYTNAPDTLIELVAGSGGLGTHQNFTLPGGSSIGFYLNTGTNVFRTDAGLNVGDSTSQNHFALFSDPPGIPEPSTFAMLLGGFATLAVARKRK